MADGNYDPSNPVKIEDFSTGITFVFPNDHERKEFFDLRKKYSELKGMYKTKMAGIQFKFKHREDKTAFAKMWKQYEDPSSINAVFSGDRQ